MTTKMIPIKDGSITVPDDLRERYGIEDGSLAAGATHLLTGDKRHFGAYFDQRFEGVLIVTPRTYLQSRIACNR